MRSLIYIGILKGYLSSLL